MAKNDKTVLFLDFISRVKLIVAARTGNAISSSGCAVDCAQLMPDKMLRTRLAAQLVSSGAIHVNHDTLINACAATEMVHTASLYHDDFIDRGLLRRSQPALWLTTSPTAAILIGDALLCEAMELLVETIGTRYVKYFVSKVHEVCATEIEQELVLRDKRLDEHTCVRIARQKTGPLFAFVGLVCGGDNAALSSALEEAGYRIGTAYQLTDDLLDIGGDEVLSGKTLGSDSRRGKFTLPQSIETTQSIMCQKISELCLSALECLNEWPQIRRGLEQYLKGDLQSTFDRIDSGIRISV